MRLIVIPVALLGLAACTPKVPDSAAGVGFRDYPTYQAEREAQLQGRMPAVDAYGQPVGGQPLTAIPGGPAATAAPSGFSTERLGAAIDAAEQGGAAPTGGLPLSGGPQTGAVIGQDLGGGIAPAQSGLIASDRPRGDAPLTIQAQSGEVSPDNVGISDEQDFSAVASRESIESDAERLARNRASYQVIAPTVVPERSGDTGPNIVQFALSTTHAPGTAVYKRPGIRAANPASACQRLGSPDRAQAAFLAAGGPQKDGKGLDPDGDGFVCGWDPRPFRTVSN